MISKSIITFVTRLSEKLGKTHGLQGIILWACSHLPMHSSQVNQGRRTCLSSSWKCSFLLGRAEHKWAQQPMWPRRHCEQPLLVWHQPQYTPNLPVKHRNAPCQGQHRAPAQPWPWQQQRVTCSAKLSTWASPGAEAHSFTVDWV